MQLFKDGESNPLVNFKKHKRHFYVYWRMSRHASLEIEQECMGDLDAIVCEWRQRSSNDCLDCCSIASELPFGCKKDQRQDSSWVVGERGTGFQKQIYPNY